MSTVNSPLPYKRSDAKSYARANLQGVWGAIPYPFTPDDELDEQGLRRNIRYYIDNKLLDGIYCGHFMSEFWALTTGERKRAAEIVLDECRGGVPLMVHTGHTWCQLLPNVWNTLGHQPFSPPIASPACPSSSRMQTGY